MQKEKLRFYCNKIFLWILILGLAVVIGLCGIVAIRYDYNASRILQREATYAVLFAVVLSLIFYLRDVTAGESIPFFDALIQKRYAVSLILFVALVALGLHGTSVAWIAGYIGENTDYDMTLYGVERGIQSDSWAIILPQIFNQVEEGFPLFNTDMMTQGGNTVLGGLPAFGFSFIGQLHYWGFLFGTRIGISWLYWFKKFALFLGTYEVLAYFSRDSRRLSFVGALLLTTSPLINWWFNHTIAAVILYGQWCMVAVIWYLRSEKISQKIGAAIIGVMAATGYVYVWYPALQVSMGYLMILLVLLILIEFYKSGVRLHRVDVRILGCAFAAIILDLLGFLYVSKESIADLTSTVYPGASLFVGGGYNRAQLALYPVNFLMGFYENEVNALGTNACEASAVLPFIPAVYVAAALVLLHSLYKKTFKKHISILLLSIYSAFLVTRLFYAYPARLMQLTFFNYVSEKRSVWLIGIMSVYLGVLCLDYFAKEMKNGRMIAFLLALFSVGILYYISYVKSGLGADAIMVRRRYVLLCLLLFAVFYYFFFRGNANVSMGILIALSIFCEVTINPLSQGTGALGHSDLLDEVDVLSETDADITWAASDFVTANAVYSRGVHVFNTTNQYMDSEKWKVLDPEGDYEDFYNRYCQVTLVPTDGETTFAQILDDYICCYISLEDWAKCGIDYFVTTDVLENYGSYSDYFELVYVDGASGRRIYHVIQ